MHFSNDTSLWPISCKWWLTSISTCTSVISLVPQRLLNHLLCSKPFACVVSQTKLSVRSLALRSGVEWFVICVTLKVRAWLDWAFFCILCLWYNLDLLIWVVSNRQINLNNSMPTSWWAFTRSCWNWLRVLRHNLLLPWRLILLCSFSYKLFFNLFDLQLWQLYLL
jgi:hypothetical protein